MILLRRNYSAYEGWALLPARMRGDATIDRGTVHRSAPLERNGGILGPSPSDLFVGAQFRGHGTSWFGGQNSPDLALAKNVRLQARDMKQQPFGLA
jgi:hypothetical protein